MDVTQYTLKTVDAAKVVGLKPGLLRKMRLKGTGPSYYKPSPGMVLYSLDELRAWAKDRVKDAGKVA